MSELEEGSTAKDIIDFKPELMKVIQDEETAKMVRDDLYFPILKVLRSGPMTVREIEEEYNKIAKTPKSDKTIYRYLKTLQKADLVKAAGQRVVMGKTATETLFSRTAYAFYLRNEQAGFWRTTEGKLLAETLGKALNHTVEEKEIDIDKFQLFLEELSIERVDKLKDMLENSEDDLLESISDFDWQDFSVFYNLGGLLGVLLSDDTVIDDLRACFK